MKKIFLIVSVIAVLSLALGACGPSAPNATEEPGQTEAAPPSG